MRVFGALLVVALLLSIKGSTDELSRLNLGDLSQSYGPNGGHPGFGYDSLGYGAFYSALYGDEVLGYGPYGPGGFDADPAGYGPWDAYGPWDDYPPLDLGLGIGTGLGAGGYGDPNRAGFDLEVCKNKDQKNCTRDYPDSTDYEWRYIEYVGWRKFSRFGANRKDWWDLKRFFGYPHWGYRNYGSYYNDFYW